MQDRVSKSEYKDGTQYRCTPVPRGLPGTDCLITSLQLNMSVLTHICHLPQNTSPEAGCMVLAERLVRKTLHVCMLLGLQALLALMWDFATGIDFAGLQLTRQLVGGICVPS